MKILGNRLLVSRVQEEQKEGFQTVEVQDSFIYKGKIEQLGKTTSGFSTGDTVVFAKYSPNTQEIQVDGTTMKIISEEDVLAIL